VLWAGVGSVHLYFVIFVLLSYMASIVILVYNNIMIGVIVDLVDFIEYLLFYNGPVMLDIIELGI
jgi:hypothetical protein